MRLQVAKVLANWENMLPRPTTMGPVTDSACSLWEELLEAEGIGPAELSQLELDVIRRCKWFPSAAEAISIARERRERDASRALTAAMNEKMLPAPPPTREATPETRAEFFRSRFAGKTAQEAEMTLRVLRSCGVDCSAEIEVYRELFGETPSDGSPLRGVSNA